MVLTRAAIRTYPHNYPLGFVVAAWLVQPEPLWYGGHKIERVRRAH
jgi:hypothetical protein